MLTYAECCARVGRGVLLASFISSSVARVGIKYSEVAGMEILNEQSVFVEP